MLRQVAAVAVLIGLSVLPLRAQDTTFTVTTESANVHASPSTAGPVIGTAARGRTFEVTRELGSWVRIPWPAAPDGVGYLHVTWGRISHGGDANRATDGPPPAIARSRVEPPPPAVRGLAAAPTPASKPTPASTPTPVAVPLPSHVVGLGARMGSSSLGLAATGRAWSHGPFGVQVELGRSTEISAAASAHLTATHVASSLIYSLRNFVTDTTWVKPYVGTGATVFRMTRSDLTPGSSNVVDGGIGVQLLGGAELTWANLPQFALSADVRQQWAPHPFSGFQPGGLGCSLSLHWYVK